MGRSKLGHRTMYQGEMMAKGKKDARWRDL